MRPRRAIIISILLLLGAFTQAAAQVSPALHLRVRNLDDRPVSGITFVLRDGRDQVQTVQTGPDGWAVLAGLAGASVRIVEARSAGGQPLVMDENDAAGGLRIPLLADGEQIVDFRLIDGLLFVDPAAVTEGPIPTELAQMAQPDVTATARPTATAPLSPTDVPAPTRRGWSPWWYAVWALPLLPLVVWWLQSRAGRRPQ